VRERERENAKERESVCVRACVGERGWLQVTCHLAANDSDV